MTPDQYRKQADKKEGAHWFEYDKVALQNFLTGTPGRRSPLIFGCHSDQGWDLAEKTLEPTGEVLGRYKHSEGIDEIYEACKHPNIVRYKRIGTKEPYLERVLMEQYFKYTPEQYRSEYEAKE